ncbi:YHS domain-containing (seleno)protein [Tenacibaculum sp. SG-28]|uniref:YHS domain-containing (seleno)protein n=1 Tax=Tenacibaculum sp. SG-28 TaxID=754426 RepID=UPI000CF50FF6|nr:YHS domain-containing (seleno)protein [Tenacibaculum sp. SG-28]PQJ21857.1 hypothetical protein BSU00_07390 [Tenacibaculum sp. SG-28]
MKYYSIFFLFFLTSLQAQTLDYNIKNGFLANGYDLVSYFTAQKPVKGSSQYTYNYNGIPLQFSSQENLRLFLKNPTAYLPQYGGYCAYAIAVKKIKMKIDPETYEIRAGKLYLFYNAWFSNTLNDWLAGDVLQYQRQADANWKQLKFIQ